MIELHWLDGQVEIEGDPDDHWRAYVAILGLVVSRAPSITLRARHDGPADADRLHALVVRRGTGGARVHRERDVLVVEGDEENLDRFGSWFLGAEKADAGTHAHFEYYAGNPFVAPDSLPVIFAVRAAQPRPGFALMSLDPRNVNGTPPELAGKRLDAVICSQFRYFGELVAPYNVIHLQVDGAWHRLHFDTPVIFWRVDDGGPEPWEIPEAGFAYPLVDLGQAEALVGQTIQAYRMEAVERYGVQVVFQLGDGREAIFTNRDDTTTFSVRHPS